MIISFITIFICKTFWFTFLTEPTTIIMIYGFLLSFLISLALQPWVGLGLLNNILLFRFPLACFSNLAKSP